MEKSETFNYKIEILKMVRIFSFGKQLNKNNKAKQEIGNFKLILPSHHTNGALFYCLMFKYLVKIRIFQKNQGLMTDVVCYRIKRLRDESDYRTKGILETGRD